MIFHSEVSGGWARDPESSTARQWPVMASPLCLVILLRLHAKGRISRVERSPELASCFCRQPQSGPILRAFSSLCLLWSASPDHVPVREPRSADDLSVSFAGGSSVVSGLHWKPM